MEAKMNRVELSSNELELVNGGGERYVIDLSNHENRIALGPVSTHSKRVPDQRMSLLEYNKAMFPDW